MSAVDYVNRLPPRVQRILAFLVVPIAMMSVWGGVAWPVWHAYQSQIQWRETAVRRLAQQRGLAEIEVAVRAQLDALPSLPGWHKLYRTPGEGAAVNMLQTEVIGVLNGARAHPQSFTRMETTRLGPLRKIGLRIVVPMMIDQLEEVLAHAGTLPHFVRIERLLVNAPAVQAPKENPTLLVTMDVVGYLVDAAAADTATMMKARND